MLHVILDDKIYDKDFVNRFCIGFKELAEHVRSFSPEWAKTITRVPASRICAAAHAFATIKPGCILWGNGIDLSASSFQTARATLLLMAVTGNLDIPSGMVRYLPPQGVRYKSPQIDKSLLGLQFLPTGQKEKMIGAGLFPFAPGCHQPTFWDACVSGLPYRPRAV